ncbi:MAG: tetratricopeptide repeat protein [Streptosporangiales bacterium]|nr:tetratricopeptide repeat protein [Streptosporangiales bacterium]
MTRLAEGILPEGEPSRAEVLARAGEQWQLAGDPARAVQLFRQAIADGGRTGIDPRASLADALFEVGEAAEARDVLAALRAEPRLSPATCLTAAETLMAQGDLRATQDWATEGVRAAHGGECGPEGVELLGQLLRLRFRCRSDLGLPEDDYDRMLDAGTFKASQ